MPRILARGAIVASLAIALSSAAAAAQSSALAAIPCLTPREHREQGFVPASPQTVAVEALAGQPRREHNARGNKFGDWNDGPDEERDVWPAAAWIVDAHTRQVVWDVRTAQTERDRSGVRRF